MTELFLTKWPIRLSLGLGAGAAIAAVDNVLFEGEVSPIVVIGLLLAATAAAGTAWGQRGWVAAIAAWIWVPSAHLAKHILGLPDTLHPNTYASILMLATFSLAVAVVGTGCGLLVRRLAAGPPKTA
jgi:hypothetical protein